MRWDHLIKWAWICVFAGASVIGAITLTEYQGSSWIYLLFTALSLAVLRSGFGRTAIFFDAFIGVLLFIGFWLKFSVRTAFSEGRFYAPVGGFDGTPESFDKALLVVSCALAAILLARFVRGRWFFIYPQALPSISYVGLFAFYRHYRRVFLVTFTLAVLAICVANAWFGIYQRGLLPRVDLPLGLNGVFTWLLLFGMASVSAIILRFELELHRESYWLAIIIALLEAALSNVSMWSRGMILNGSSLLYGVAALFRRGEQRLRLGLVGFALASLISLFALSVFGVNWLRAQVYYDALPEPQMVEAVVNDSVGLLLDRWVGIEGVMSVVGANRTGWGLFAEALAERANPNANSFYDQNFIDSPYNNARDDARHFVSLPGYLAFLFYPGSYIFLFCAVFAFSIVAGLFEWFVYRFGGNNLVLCALIAQVIAFRYTSFGYVPMQSYLLFGAISLNVLILYWLNKILGSNCVSRFWPLHKAAQ